MVIAVFLVLALTSVWLWSREISCLWRNVFLLMVSLRIGQVIYSLPCSRYFRRCLSNGGLGIRRCHCIQGRLAKVLQLQALTQVAPLPWLMLAADPWSFQFALTFVQAACMVTL